jgi:hypothetical protein
MEPLIDLFNTTISEPLMNIIEELDINWKEIL